MEGGSSRLIAIDRRVEEIFAGTLELVLSLEGIEETSRGAEIRYCNYVSWQSDASCAVVYTLPADTDMPAPAMTTILRRLCMTCNSLSNCSCSADATRSLRRLRCSVVRSLGVTRRFFAGGGPSLSDTIVSSGAGDPVCELSCEGGGDGRLMCVMMRVFGNVVKTLFEKESRSSGGGVGVRADPSDETGEPSREGSDEGGLESSLSLSIAAAGSVVAVKESGRGCAGRAERIRTAAGILLLQYHCGQQR